MVANMESMRNEIRDRSSLLLLLLDNLWFDPFLCIFSLLDWENLGFSPWNWRLNLGFWREKKVINVKKMQCMCKYVSCMYVSNRFQREVHHTVWLCEIRIQPFSVVVKGRICPWSLEDVFGNKNINFMGFQLLYGLICFCMLVVGKLAHWVT